MNENTKTTAIQLIKYGIVGISNSLLTLIVIFVCNSLLNMSLFVADIIGYVAGVINSFIWNKQWVFKTRDTKIIKEMSLFVSGFLVCFGIQFITLLLITEPMINLAVNTLGAEGSLFGLSSTSIGEYVAVVIGMAVYTICNYIFNRCVTFKEKKA